MEKGCGGYEHNIHSSPSLPKLESEDCGLSREDNRSVSRQSVIQKMNAANSTSDPTRRLRGVLDR